MSRKPLKIFLVIGFLLSLGLSGCSQVPLNKPANTPEQSTIILTKRQTLKQEISISDRNFSQINFLVNNDSETTNRYRFAFKLFDVQGRLLRKVYKKNNFSGKRFIFIKFKPLKNSKNKRYVFSLMLKSAKPLSFFYEFKQGTSFYVDNTIQSDSTLIYKAFIRMDFRALTGSFASRFLSDKPFTLSYLLLLTGLIGWTIKAFLKKEGKK